MALCKDSILVAEIADMRNLLTYCSLAILAACSEPVNDETSVVLAQGQMPTLASGNNGKIFLTFGRGDSILFAVSTNQGDDFSQPVLVDTLPNLASSHMCGPQTGATNSGALILACTRDGNIYSYSQDNSGKWQSPARVNDVDTVAKENFISLATDGDNALAVWLDLRDGHNKIFASRSTDAGRHWSANFLVYASPDSTVCECCKPSVLLQDNKAYIMFRNWLAGNRDLYLSTSNDGGKTFDSAQKLGTASWALEGCPMDGGALSLDADKQIQTVWNRKGLIYWCQPGQPEIKIGEGRSVNMASRGTDNLFCWVQNDHIILTKQKGKKQVIGEGQLPQILLTDNHKGLVVWEQDKQIKKKIIRF